MNKQQHPLIQAIDSIGNAVDKALLIAIDDESPDNLLARLAEARAGVVRCDLITHVIDVPHDVARIYADEVRPEPLTNGKALPQLQKQKKDYHKGVQRPGISKLLKTGRDFLCPSCAATPGTPCFRMTGPGHRSRATEERRPDGWYHGKRSELATEHNNKARARYDREHYA